MVNDGSSAATLDAASIAAKRTPERMARQLTARLGVGVIIAYGADQIIVKAVVA